MVICDCVFREACEFAGFYFVAVNNKEAIMAGNIIRLAKARTPIGGESHNETLVR